MKEFGIIVCILVAMSVSWHTAIKIAETQAINAGVAYYEPVNGNFTWRTNYEFSITP